MADLYINGSLVKEQFMSDDKFTFDDYMGGSTNIVELKDGSKVIDKHQFTLTQPKTRWLLMYATLGDDGASIQNVEVLTTFTDSDEVAVKLQKSKNSLMALFRAKCSLDSDVVIPSSDYDSFISNFIDDSGNPTERTIVFDNLEYSLNLDATELSGVPKANSGIELSFVTSDVYESNEMYKTRAGQVGVSKQLIIENIKATDQTDSKNFTINIEWV